MVEKGVGIGEGRCERYRKIKQRIKTKLMNDSCDGMFNRAFGT
jgi:hypothetical protein